MDEIIEEYGGAIVIMVFGMAIITVIMPILTFILNNGASV